VSEKAGWVFVLENSDYLFVYLLQCRNSQRIRNWRRTLWSMCKRV